ncbi:MAG: hypothetical protein ACOC10_11910, partial [Bacteroidota bacterium]
MGRGAPGGASPKPGTRLVLSPYPIKAKAALKNPELLKRFREVETRHEKEKSVLPGIIGSYIGGLKLAHCPPTGPHYATSQSAHHKTVPRNHTSPTQN